MIFGQFPLGYAIHALIRRRILQCKPKKISPRMPPLVGRPVCQCCPFLGVSCADGETRSSIKKGRQIFKNARFLNMAVNCAPATEWKGPVCGGGVPWTRPDPHFLLSDLLYTPRRGGFWVTRSTKNFRGPTQTWVPPSLSP